MLVDKHLSDEQLALYADASIRKTLSSIDQEIVEHIKSCNSCAEKALAIIAIAEDVEDELELQQSISWKRSFLIRTVASVTLILGAAIIYYMVHKTRMDNAQQIAKQIDSAERVMEPKLQWVELKHKEPVNLAKEKKRSKQKIEKQNKSNKPKDLLTVYTPNENLDLLVNRFSESVLREEFSIDMPSEIVVKQNQEIELQWNNSNNKLLVIEFYDNEAKKVFEEETDENKYSIGKLEKKGLFYWKLLNKDFDLLFCGKIRVK